MSKMSDLLICTQSMWCSVMLAVHPPLELVLMQKLWHWPQMVDQCSVCLVSAKCQMWTASGPVEPWE